MLFRDQCIVPLGNVLRLTEGGTFMFDDAEYFYQCFGSADGESRLRRSSSSPELGNCRDFFLDL